MIKLVVSVIGVQPSTAREVVLARVESRTFDPSHFDSHIGTVLDAARKTANALTIAALRSWKPEVSIRLTADDELVRPALHLTEHVLQLLSEAGASLDFDPYV